MEETSSPTAENSNTIYIWKFPIDRSYVKSISSILKVAAACIALIAFICCASGRSDVCDKSYSSTYNFFEFVTMSSFITLLILWFFFALTLNTKLFFKLLPWTLIDLGYLILYIVLYLIANIVLAAQACGKDSNKAGAAFGFFAMFCLCGNFFFVFRDWRSSRNQSASSSAGKTQEYNSERNIEQY
ncbi:CKLF-like MARVEL transmembrane domain-containing protein 4 [Physella acuta]|uniref:CKLF-like MARVEL transmembrane domain-containing protein 4 n=1 Tax=Physella acuta TaxID=109671 RepID=UPI0027DAFAEB|nr:CKLF-like MARVEL transmembrane domain-containing protein 4 [Physella acuta]